MSKALQVDPDSGKARVFYNIPRSLTLEYLAHFQSVVVPERVTPWRARLDLLKVTIMEWSTRFELGVRFWRNMNARWFRSWLVKHGHPEMAGWPLEVFHYSILLTLNEMDIEAEMSRREMRA